MTRHIQTKVAVVLYDGDKVLLQENDGIFNLPNSPINFGEIRSGAALRVIMDMLDVRFADDIENAGMYEHFHLKNSHELHEIVIVFRCKATQLLKSQVRKKKKEGVDIGWYSFDQCTALNIEPGMLKYKLRHLPNGLHSFTCWANEIGVVLTHEKMEKAIMMLPFKRELTKDEMQSIKTMIDIDIGDDPYTKGYNDKEPVPIDTFYGLESWISDGLYSSNKDGELLDDEESVDLESVLIENLLKL